MVASVQQQAARTPLPEMTRFLQNILSGRLLALVCGLDSTNLIQQLAGNGDVDVPLEVEERLRCAYEIVLLLLHFDAPGTIRAWLIGMNPELGDESVAMTIRDGRFKDAMRATRAFIAYG